MAAIYALIKEIWQMICLFLLPIEVLLLPAADGVFGRMKLGSLVLGACITFLKLSLGQVCAHPERFVAFLERLRSVAGMIPSVLVSGSQILQCLRFEHYPWSDVDVFCMSSCWWALFRHLTEVQGMRLVSVLTKSDLAQIPYFRSDLIHSIFNFYTPGKCCNFQVIVPRRFVKHLGEMVLDFDLNIVQNYFDGVMLFSAWPRAVLKKRMRACSGKEVTQERVTKYTRRGYHLVDRVAIETPSNWVTASADGGIS